MNLNQLFDVVRGFNPESDGPSIAESFKPTGTLSYSVAAIVPGHIVTLLTTGLMDLADSPDRSSVAPLPVWMAVMANDFDNSFTGKFVAVRGNVMVKTDVFTGSSYNPGVLVTMRQGKIDVAANKDQIIGEVIEDNRTTNLADGTLTIYFSGGMERMF